MKNNLTLLYVEDDELIRENLTQIFKMYFDKVLTTDNGNEALNIYNQNHIDLAILDISIPGINGLNLASKIRELDNEILIIMLTAYSDKEKLLQAVNLQLFYYLIKPIDLKKLTHVIDEALAKLYAQSTMDLGHNYKWHAQSKILFYNNKEIKISKNERRLIELLSANSNRYYSACEIDTEILIDADNKHTNCNNGVVT